MRKYAVILALLMATAISTTVAAQQPPDFLNSDFEQCTSAGESPPPGWDSDVGEDILPASCETYAGSWAAKTSMIFDEELQTWRNVRLCQTFSGTGIWGARFKCGSAENYVGSFFIFGYGENYVSDYFNFTCAKDGTLYQREGYFDYAMTNPQICAQFTGSTPVYYDDFELLFMEATPTPTPAPTPTPQAGTVYTETEVRLQALGACRQAIIECESSGPVDLYVNGIFVGCPAQSSFYPRQIYSDTALFVVEGTTATFEISSRCDLFIAQDVPTFPTSTPEIMHPMTSSFVMPGNRWGIDFTFQNGELPWLDIGTDLIDLVNAGNLLYIMGGILLAALVLSWAINKVKHPD